MRKTYLLMLCSMALYLVSCGNNQEKKANEHARSDANEIILYTNKVTNYLNETNIWLKFSQDGTQKLLEVVDTKKADAWSAITDIPATFTYIKTSIPEPTEALDETDRQFFKENTDRLAHSLTTLEQRLKALKGYISVQDYKDDRFERGVVLSDSIKELLNNVYSLQNALYGKIDNIADEAEAVLLQDHPLYEPIMAARGDIKKADEVYTAFAEYNNDNMSAEEVLAKYNSLVESVEKNKSSYADILQKNGKKIPYNQFYEEMGTLLDTYKISQRTVQENKKVSKWSISTMKDKREFVIKKYNSFVD